MDAAADEGPHVGATPETLVAATLERFGRLDVVMSNDIHPAPARGAGEATAGEMRAALVAHLATTPGIVQTGSIMDFAGDWPRGRVPAFG